MRDRKPPKRGKSRTVKATSLVTEEPDERRMFDDQARLLGHPLKAVAAALYVWGKMRSGGSFEQQCYIMGNECAKAAITPITKRRKRHADR